MQLLKIICIDDQREVLATLHKDLNHFENYCQIIECESAAEAEEVLDEIDAAGNELALIICDHIMPGKNGIDFLIEFHHDLRFPHAKKLLLTGMATHQDTIQAINEADIDHYIEKPWDRSDLIQTTKKLLTDYILEAGLDYQPYLTILDQPRLYQKMRHR